MDQSKDYYKILGVDRNASEQDIKKAYRKMSLKYHPDRQVGKSESEKKAAEEKFKEAAEAYDTLGDKDKKQQYDNPGFGPGGFSFDFNGFGGNPFADMFGHRGPQQNNSADYIGETTYANLVIDLKDLYNLGYKKVSYLKKERCSVCNGDGGTGKQTCPHCHGTGMITKTQMQGNTIFQSSSPCPHCHGTGYTIEHKCNSCSGIGFNTKLKEYNFDMSSVSMGILSKNGSRINVGQYGSDSKNPSGNQGDLILTVKLAIDTNKYAIMNGVDVYERVKIPFVDMVLGTSLEVKLPNNKTYKVNVPECTQPGTKLKLNGKGLSDNGNHITATHRVGDYIIVVEPVFPESITKEQHKILEKYKSNEKDN